MGREQAAAAVRFVHRLDHRPGQRQAVIRRGAATDLVEDDEAALARLRQNRRGLDHLDHEGRAAACEIVAGADTAEQAVHQPDFRPRRRDVAAGLRQQHDQRVLPQEGGLAAHVGAADQPQPVVGRELTIVGHEALARLPQRGFDHRMAAAFDLQARLLDDLRPAPAAFSRALGLSGRHIDPRQRRRRGGNRLARGDGFADQLLEMRLLRRQRMAARFGDAARFLVQRERIEAHRAGHRLAVGEAAVGRHQRIGVTARHLDEIAEHAVVPDLERGHPGLVAVLRFERGDRAARMGRDRAQLIERRIVALGDEAALAALGRRGRNEGA